jgi:hypothetical protein
VSRAVLTDARQLNWSAARDAAQRIIKRCDDASFTAPEALDVIRAQIQAVADDLNTIAAALLITTPETR